MNPENWADLQQWLHGRHYVLKRDGDQLLLSRQGQLVAVVTPPDRYEIKATTMNFNEWVEFNKCLRNIRHYLLATNKVQK